MSKVVMHIKNLIKEYTNKTKTVRALNNISFSINEGEIFGLLGVNGAGKTTLSTILATLHPPTYGDVLFNNESIYNDLIGFRKKLGFCKQHANLDTHLNVRQNLEYAGRYFLLSEQVVQERVDELLNQFNLQQYAMFEINELSGGYKQRVMIARALVHKPKLLILDEPTVALDPSIRRQLWGCIRDLKKEGVSIVLTTHYIEEAEVLSDRVCILHEGKIVLIDKPENLKKQFKKGNLEEVFLELTSEESE